jgi:hypothetical protein
MFMEMSSVSRSKITSSNSTHPTAKSAKQILIQHNTRHERPYRGAI